MKKFFGRWMRPKAEVETTAGLRLTEHWELDLVPKEPVGDDATTALTHVGTYGPPGIKYMNNAGEARRIAEAYAVVVLAEPCKSWTPFIDGPVEVMFTPLKPGFPGGYDRVSLLIHLPKQAVDYGLRFVFDTSGGLLNRDIRVINVVRNSLKLVVLNPDRKPQNGLALSLHDSDRRIRETLATVVHRL